MRFKVYIEKRALLDIQNAIDYYNSKQKGLGKKFYLDYLASVNSLKRNPYFQVRYNNVRCLPTKKFPFMIHFTLEEEAVTIYAVISTYLNPEDHWVH